MSKKSEALLEEEAIIRKRFLTQTSVATSGSDGPPFRKLLDIYQRVFDVSGGEKVKELTSEFLAALYHIQSHLNKLRSVANLYIREQKICQGKHEQLMAAIQKVTDDIVDCKVELERARIESLQVKECEAVKDQIVKVPARSKTTEEIGAVRKEIEDLRKQQVLLDMAAQHRRLQFMSIAHMISQVESQFAMENSMQNIMGADIHSTIEVGDGMAVDD